MARVVSAIQREMLLRVADAVPAIVALYNISTGQYIYVNQALSRLLGYLPEEFMDGGMEFIIALVHPDDLPELLQSNQRALDFANQNPDRSNEVIASFEYRMLHKDGSWRWLHTEGTVFGRNTLGKVELILNVSLDITERKKAELQLKRSLKILEGVLSSE